MGSIRAPSDSLLPFARRFALLQRRQNVELLRAKEQFLLFDRLGGLEFYIFVLASTEYYWF